MIVIVQDTWRAVLVLVVGVLLMEAYRRPAPPVVVTSPQPAPVMPVMQAWPVVQQPERPLRRVFTAVTELGDSVIGVVR